MDGPITKKVGGAGVFLISPEGEILKYTVILQYLATNNEAEYKALLTRLRACLVDCNRYCNVKVIPII